MLSALQRLLAGYPSKNSNNRKIESARGTMGRGKRREPLLFLLAFHFPSCSGSLFLSPQPPYNNSSAEERGFIAFMVLGLRSLWYYVVIKVSTSHGFHRFHEFCDFKGLVVFIGFVDFIIIGFIKRELFHGNFL